jgi:Protein of unknown function (DUF416)
MVSSAANGYSTLLAKHREAVLEALAGGSRAARTAFAASCAEVLYPLWVLYCERIGEPAGGAVRAALDACWEWAQSGSDSGVDPARLADITAELAPRSDDSPSKLAPWAQNAALATAAALDAWSGGHVDRVAAANDRVVESLDYVVADPPEPAELEVIRTELVRQRRALSDDVSSVRADATSSEVAAFIRRAWTNRGSSP